MTVSREQHASTLVFAADHFAITNWSSFPLYDVCFAGADKRPIRVGIPARAFDGLAIILPAAPHSGASYEIVLGLKEHAMQHVTLDWTVYGQSE